MRNETSAESGSLWTVSSGCFKTPRSSRDLDRPDFQCVPRKLGFERRRFVCRTRLSRGSSPTGSSCSRLRQICLPRSTRIYARRFAARSRIMATQEITASWRSAASLPLRSEVIGAHPNAAGPRARRYNGVARARWRADIVARGELRTACSSPRPPSYAWPANHDVASGLVRQARSPFPGTDR